jgi:PGF-pre-PGF domain-containing protein
MKAGYLNSIISVLLIILIIPGIIPIVAFAADGESGDGGNSTNGTTPELKLGDLYVEPKVPRPNSEVTISALVQNVGDAASEPTYVLYTINGVESSDSEYVKSIDPGSKETISHTWTTSDQEGTVIIKASLENIDNSQKTVSVSVENPRPDLTIESIVPEPANPQEGNPLNLTVEVKNQGAGPSNAALAKYYINGVPGQDLNIPPLSEGESTDIVFSLTPDQVKGGKMQVKVVVDSGSTVSESNEGNNEFTKTINVKGLLPDIESLSLSPEAPKTGASITFTATIKNNGPGASSSSGLKYDINGTGETYSGTIPVPALAAGGTTQVTFLWTPGNEGNIEVKAMVDAGTVVPESDETNNARTITATVSKESTSTDGGGGSSSGGGGGGGSSSSSSSGSGGMGSSSSKELASNVAGKELVTRYVTNGDHIRYDFPKNSTCVVYIEYDAERTFQKTTTTVEMLKNKSRFVPILPNGRIYKSVNIWVGDKGGGLPTSLKNGLIEFRVEKSWINDSNVNESLITLQWYNKSWEPLSTEKVGEDNNYVYFNSKTPGFSMFAITGTGTGTGTTQIGATLQDILRIPEGSGNASINGSAKKSKAEEARGMAKILMAISLPLFLIFVGYLLVKKKL